MNSLYDPFDFDPDDGLGSELLDHLEYENNTMDGSSDQQVATEPVADGRRVITRSAATAVLTDGRGGGNLEAALAKARGESR